MASATLSRDKRQMNFFLSGVTVQHLNSYVPKGRQSQFVEQAIEGSLSSLKFRDALEKSFGSWKEHPRSSESFVRSLRKSSRHTR